jgi:hypothetical protein
MQLRPSESLLGEMIKIQEGLNTKSYSTEWLEKGATQEFDYEIAAAQEVGEFLDSLPFAWWSSPTPDPVNCVTELVDAWHFIMSQVIIDNQGSLEKSLEFVYHEYQHSFRLKTAMNATGITPGVAKVKKDAKWLVAMLYVNSDAQCPEYGRKYVRAFFDLCTSFGLSLDHLYARYVAKATLNKFRMENGYSSKPRTYHKMWNLGNGMHEDNFYVATFVDESVSAGKDINASLVEEHIKSSYTKHMELS